MSFRDGVPDESIQVSPSVFWPIRHVNVYEWVCTKQTMARDPSILNASMILHGSYLALSALTVHFEDAKG